MSAIASQITSLTIVYSTDYPGADQSKHQSSASLAFVWGIHRGPVNSPHKWPVTRKMFPFDDVIMAYSGAESIAGSVLAQHGFHRRLTIASNEFQSYFWYVPSQWETVLLCNDVSHWLGKSLESALNLCHTRIHLSSTTANNYPSSVFLIFGVSELRRVRPDAPSLIRELCGMFTGLELLHLSDTLTLCNWKKYVIKTQWFFEIFYNRQRYGACDGRPSDGIMWMLLMDFRNISRLHTVSHMYTPAACVMHDA